MRKILILSGICIVHAIAWGQEADKTKVPISFEDALQLSVENNLAVVEKTKDQEIKEKEKQVKRGLYMPTVTLGASYMAMSSDITMDLNPLKEAILPLYTTLGNYGDFSDVPNPSTGEILSDAYSTASVRNSLLEAAEDIENSDWTETIQKKNFGVVNISAAYPIYAGGKIRNANKAAKIEIEESENETNIAKGEITTQLVERYYGLALANEALQVRQEVFDNVSTHLDNAKKLKAQGMISHAEFLHVQVYYSEAEREFKKAERMVEIANNALLNTFSMTGDTTFIPSSEIFYATSINELQYYLNSIGEQSDLLKKVEYKKQLAEVKHKVEIGEMLPTVAAMGTYNIADKDLSSMVPDYLVGVTVSLPLFEGGAKYKKVQASKILNEKVEVVHEKVQMNLHMAVTKYYQEMSMYLEEIQELETAQQFADEYYRVRNKAFSEGMATAAEVSDANLALAKVKIERFQAMYNFDVALAKTLYYSGQINEFTSYTK